MSTHPPPPQQVLDVKLPLDEQQLLRDVTPYRTHPFLALIHSKHSHPLARPPTPFPRSPRLQVLDVKLPFDEQQLLRDNTPYLLRALNLGSLSIHSAADGGAAAAAKADLSSCYPAQPVVMFAAVAPGSS